jgi:SAM-dependent methyltransferase
LPTDRRLRHALPLYRWRTRTATPLATLTRLFLIGEAVPESAARDAVHPLSLEALRGGLLAATDGAVRAALQIVPFQGVLIAADWTDAALVEPVMGVAASTRALAQMMVPRPVGRALDLGTGSGVLALLAARHAGHVTAVDLNSRAAELTRSNAALNEVSNLDCRTGDMFEPVRDETFDLIVCNPPFVIAPAAGRLHSQSGRPADDFLRSIVRNAPQYLRSGGFCQLVGNWVHPAGSDWQRRLAVWFDGLGCDAWVLHARTEDSATYAHHRIGETTDDSTQAGRLFDEWMDYYQREGIEAIGYGVITLRKSTRPTTWYRCDPLPEIVGPCGSAIERGFALRDFLADHADDRSLLASRVRRADGLRWEQQRDAAAGGWTAAGSRLRLTTGLLFEGTADAGVAEFVARCSGATCLGADLDRLAAELKRDRTQFASAFLKVVRRLIEVGILVPVENR